MTQKVCPAEARLPDDDEQMRTGLRTSTTQKACPAEVRHPVDEKAVPMLLQVMDCLRANDVVARVLQGLLLDAPKTL